MLPKKPNLKARKSLLGKQFERLTVIEEDYSSSYKTKLICRCTCGTVKKIFRGDIRKIKSCGCYKKQNRITHGATKTKLYSTWRSMRERCTNPKAAYYHVYGGRGITVCEEWARDFSVFRDWALKNGYKWGLQFDRIDNDKGYSPDNCRLVTPKVNNRNTRRNVRHNFFGEMLTIGEAEEKYEFTAAAIKRRILVAGMTPDESVTFPKGKHFKKSQRSDNGRSQGV